MDQKKILLIEDDDFLRELYLDILTREGYSVEFAEDGTHGLEKFKKGGWDLILSDMVLPEMSGLEIARTALKEVTDRKLYNHLVFMTNMYNDAQEKEALTIGEAYMIKIQLTPDTFLNEVKKHI
jgi:CheY-like chemotaxis protein